MSMTKKLHDLGQSLWLDNITRGILEDGTLRRYIAEYSVTGLTSNPTIFDEAIGGSSLYDDGIRKKAKAGASGEGLFVDLALEDLKRAADLFRPIFDRTDGVDGWVSMEVSPLLADDTRSTIEAACSIHKLADRPNLYVKIPGTPAGVPAIEEAIFSGVPVNVTLLFSREQYVAVAEAYMRGLERRIAAKLDVRASSSVASLFNRLGIAMAARAYKAHCDLVKTERWRALAAAGARPQRMLWASTGTKDPKASPTLYVEALAAPGTVDTMPEKTLAALAANKENAAFTPTLAADGVDAENVIARFTAAGIDVDALAKTLQLEGAESFVKSWKELMQSIADKSATLATT
jgi:transaldolase